MLRYRTPIPSRNRTPSRLLFGAPQHPISDRIFPLGFGFGHLFTGDWRLIFFAPGSPLTSSAG
jgi:hypothetical protein